MKNKLNFSGSSQTLFIFWSAATYLYFILNCDRIYQDVYLSSKLHNMFFPIPLNLCNFYFIGGILMGFLISYLIILLEFLYTNKLRCLNDLMILIKCKVRVRLLLFTSLWNKNNVSWLQNKIQRKRTHLSIAMDIKVSTLAARVLTLIKLENLQ